MRIGVDFGTTHTSAAYWQAGQVHFIPLEGEKILLRSLIYIDRQHEHTLGTAAAQKFLQHDTGRPVVLEEKMVGTIENTVANLEGSEPIHIVYDVTIEEDVGVRGRLLQSVKTGLRSASYTGTRIFERWYSLEELVARILRRVRARVEQTLGQPVTAATLGRPVRFGATPAQDQQAEERLRAAATLAGFESVDFVLEPVAAARFYLEQVEQLEHIFVFDFGGGTLDFTLLRAGSSSDYAILASHGLALGGDDLDSTLMREQIAPRFGSRSVIDVNYDGQPIAFPDDLAKLLEGWQTISVLSRPQQMKLIERAIKYSPDAEKFQALRRLVQNNYGFAVFEAIEQAKRRLSTQQSARVQMRGEAIELAVPVSRREFNLLISDAVADARQGVRATLGQAEVDAEAVDVVVTTGGSSAVPLFQQMLAQLFPAARRVQSDVFGSVTAGLALCAQETPRRSSQTLERAV